MRTAIISRHPAPYRDPLLSRLANDPRFEVDIYNEQPLDAGHSFWDLKEHGYEATPLFVARAGVVSRVLRIFRLIVFGRYDFILWPGFTTAELTVAAFVSALFRRKYAFAADTIVQRKANALKLWVKRYIVKHASFIHVPGKAGVLFWNQAYGVPLDRIIVGAYALDGVKMRNELAGLRLQRESLCNRYKLKPSDTVFLMVANMIPTRHYPITAEGFVTFAEKHPAVRFVMVGRGPELAKMQTFAKEHPALVVVPGCSFDEMKALYALADVYVHGGTEPASTALVIGAIAGLPLVSSDAVGCSADVLVDGESGVRVEEYLSASAWATAFERVMSQRTYWPRLGARANEMARTLDVDNVYPLVVDRLVKSIHE